MLRLILLVFSFVIFVILSFGMAPRTTWDLHDLALAFFVASQLFGGIGPAMSWPTVVNNKA